MKKAMLLLLLLTACSAGNPIPDNSIQSCIEMGGAPIYESGGHGTKFTCEFRKVE